MKIFDKSMWQIDKGIPKEDVTNHFKTVFEWLNAKKMLTAEGKEVLDLSLFDDVSLHERQVNDTAAKFLDKYYDKYINEISYGKDINGHFLEEIYQNILKNI